MFVFLKASIISIRNDSNDFKKDYLEKLKKFIKIRRNNANHFKEIMKTNQNLIIQKEVGESSWFGFSLIVREEYGLSRNELINFLDKNLIEYRPIVTGNFAKQPVIKYLNYDLSQDLKNADYVDRNGLFIGNHQKDIRGKLDLLLKF